MWVNSNEMDKQHPKVTLEWALRSLERAIQHLEDGWAERRVRRQFHQLLLAVEREALQTEDEDTNPVTAEQELVDRR
jgi:hypothetical protein